MRIGYRERPDELHMDMHGLHNSTDLALGERLGAGGNGAHGVEVDVRNGGLWYSQRAPRQVGIAITAMAFGLLFLIAPLAFPESVPGADVAARAVKVVSMLFGICLLLVAAYQSSAGVGVRIDRKEIERIRSWGGITLHRRAVRPSDVEELRILAGSPSLQPTYDLVCRGTFGSLRLLGGVPDREFLERLRRQIMLAAGIRPSGTH
jgi:hypothetical protein